MIYVRYRLLAFTHWLSLWLLPSIPTFCHPSVNPFSSPVSHSVTAVSHKYCYTHTHRERQKNTHAQTSVCDLSLSASTHRLPLNFTMGTTCSGDEVKANKFNIEDLGYLFICQLDGLSPLFFGESRSHIQSVWFFLNHCSVMSNKATVKTQGYVQNQKHSQMKPAVHDILHFAKYFHSFSIKLVSLKIPKTTTSDHSTKKKKPP